MDFEEFRDRLFDKAKEQTPDTLHAFVMEVATEYNYDSTMYAVATAACMMAAMSALDKTVEQGMNMQEKNYVMYALLEHAFGMSMPCKVVEYQDLLFPFRAHEFKTIPLNVWNWVKEQARRDLDDPIQRKLYPQYVLDHWEQISNDEPPFGLIVEQKLEKQDGVGREFI